MTEVTSWPSPAKLNLFLYITGRRPDGYHNLQTLFQFIDYCDYLSYVPRSDNKIRLVTDFENVEHDDNLIIKSAHLLCQYAKTHHLPLPNHYGVDITIDKKLPMGGGLGGGSSNAATTLVALNQLWQLSLSVEQLMTIGTQLGADVPVFIFGYSAFAQGIGDQLQIASPDEKWYLIVKADVNIATASIFNHPELKRDTVTKDINELLTTPFTNDCEPVVRKLYPQIDQLITLLSSQTPTRLTGTGACIFCECDSEKHAEELQKFIRQTPNIKPMESFIAKGINRSPLTSSQLK